MVSLELQFPFVQISQAQAAFGNIPNYSEVLEACPKEFFSNRYNEWSEFAMKIFFKGLTKDEFAQLVFKSNDANVQTAQLTYLQAWLGSYVPRHEDKEAVCGWLLSEMLTECPKFG